MGIRQSHDFVKSYCIQAELISSNEDSLVFNHFTQSNYFAVCLLKQIRRQKEMLKLLNLEYMKVYIDVYAHVRHVEHPSSNPVPNIEAALRQVDQLKQDIFKM